MPKHNETEMYGPVRKLFTDMGYKVNAEVKDCDVTACRDGELIIIELKNSFNMKLLYQGIDRQAMTNLVYLAVPRPRRFNAPDERRMRQIAKRLGFGLIFVALDGPLRTAEIIFAPNEDSLTGVRKNSRKKNAVLNEISGRKLDTNKGGSGGVKLNTAYRERCIKIACIIEQRGDKTAKELIRDYGCEKDAGAILSRGHYDWFTRVGRGVYGLSQKGRAFLEGDEFRTQVDYYRMLYKLT